MTGFIFSGADTPSLVDLGFQLDENDSSSTFTVLGNVVITNDGGFDYDSNPSGILITVVPEPSYTAFTVLVALGWVMVLRRGA